MASNSATDSSSSAKDKIVWYFAFGANMASKVLIGRRQVQPIESYPCIVNGYDLQFDMKGLPYFEPAFASISKSEKAIGSIGYCHGVVHKITREQMDHIRRTEGGNGHDDLGYREIIVQAQIYEPFYPNDGFVDKYRKASEDASWFGQTIDAIALQAVQPDIVDALPSARYLNILREGAREYGVAKVWQDHLNLILEPYNPVGGLSLRNAGRFSFAACIIPLFIFPALVMIVTHLSKMKPPYIAALYFKFTSTLLWILHDNIWSKLFGSGKNNQDLKDNKKN
ncbi:predicted protein [Naegleria gruberi]|uniref:gamma-glutamylcyclotransferase n=1 Tax=Naegleria gruberi TaxID=5762 RepID=D2V3Q8_NAEGR|nr:uncharacterized protein NAEGRDRAFT_63453 [Naegleria gruberi]EFC48817.1 predicted protein [Naegleria gruberi]|eukprot:XP_002681561.1 predicted protein [Naegleria gruberi strain NEG-M]